MYYLHIVGLSAKVQSYLLIKSVSMAALCTYSAVICHNNIILYIYSLMQQKGLILGCFTVIFLFSKLKFNCDFTLQFYFPPLSASDPLTCMSWQSAQTRTRPGRGHIPSGRAPVGVAPPACAPPPGSEKPRPPTPSSGPRSCCSGLQIWPQCSARRTTPWASY